LELGDNTFTECWGEKDHRLVVGELGAFRVEAAAAGRPARLLANVVLANQPQTAAYWSLCKKMLATEGSGPDPHSVLKLQKAQLVFNWNGTTFVLDRSSISLLHKSGIGTEDSSGLR